MSPLSQNKTWFRVEASERKLCPSNAAGSRRRREVSFPPTLTAGSWRPDGGSRSASAFSRFGRPAPRSAPPLGPERGAWHRGLPNRIRCPGGGEAHLPCGVGKALQETFGLHMSVRSAQALRLLASWSPGLVCLSEATGYGDEGAEGNAAAPALEFTASSGGGGRVANITSSPCLI